MTGFDKQALLNLMAYPTEVSDQELDALDTVLNDYPYFQLGYSLMAKAKHDKQTHDAHDALTLAAIYAPNRSLLRKFFYENLKIEPTFMTDSADEVSHTDEDMTVTEVEDPAIDEDNEAAQSFNVPENYDPPYAQENSMDEEQVIESDEVYDELEENLRKLRESKNQFSEDESEIESKKKIADDNSTSQNTNIPQKKTEHDIAPLLMDFVKESDDQPLVVGNREQNELIDKFINSDRRDWLNANKVESQKEEETNDLSENSVHVSDDVITENLAEIYVRQGKKERAIEIYHKLIWKFPQKKAYFAEMIENLKAE